jgi:hypothetical protein
MSPKRTHGYDRRYRRDHDGWCDHDSIRDAAAERAAVPADPASTGDQRHVGRRGGGWGRRDRERLSIDRDKCSQQGAGEDGGKDLVH